MRRPYLRCAAVLALACSAGALLLSACGGGSAVVASATAPTTASGPTPTSSGPLLLVGPGEPGWIRYLDPGDAFQLQAPVWMRDVTQQASAQNPLLRVAVINPAVTTTGVQVIVAPLDPGTTLGSFTATTLQRLSQIPGFVGVSAQRSATLDGEPAELIDWSATSGGSTVVEREYLVVRGNRGYVVAMDTTPALWAPDMKLFAQITSRFSFVP